MNSRRYDLDWLRIAAFAVLILYHVGMFYVPWYWHVKSSRPSAAIEPLMIFFNPWRLTLLFLISGVASRYMMDKTDVWRFALNRMGRLWPPLLLAVFIIVPPQSYYQARESVGPLNLSWLEFYWRYVTGTGHWCAKHDCVTTPADNHMWFVAYLIVYTLLLVLLQPALRRAPKALSSLIAGWGLFATPWLFLFAARATLFPLFGETLDLYDDWYLHTAYFGAFLFGFAVAKHQPFFDACVRWRFLALLTMCAAWFIMVAFHSAYGHHPSSTWSQTAFYGIREAQAWTAIIAAVGFAHRYLRAADNRWRRMLTQAIFPFYLVHQTITIVVGYHLDRIGLSLWIEVPLLIGATALGCWLFYDAARRIPPLRIWVGLPSQEEPELPLPHMANPISKLAEGERQPIRF